MPPVFLLHTPVFCCNKLLLLHATRDCCDNFVALLSTTLTKPPELRLSRFALGVLIANRTGHGDFAAYHARFNHGSGDNHCQCGMEKALGHFYSCWLGRRAMHHGWGQLKLLDVLTSAAGARRLERWLEKTGYFRTLCPRRPEQGPVPGAGPGQPGAGGDVQEAA